MVVVPERTPQEKAEEGSVSFSGVRTQHEANASKLLYTPLPDTQLVESKSSLHGALNGVQWVVPKIGPNQPDLSDGPHTSRIQNW